MNHRLNIFKKKLDRVDYLEILSKETINKDKKPSEKDRDKEKDKGEVKEKEKKKDPKEKEENSEADEEINEEGETNYYSFKKKMQINVQKKREI